MGKNEIPDRWRDYKPMGTVIPGTRFVACKVPLKETILRRLPESERFGTADLKKALPKLGLVIDLTNTDRYYSITDFTKENIDYEKIFCPGHVLPPNSIVKTFSEVVDGFVETHKDDLDAVIAVHCTHGVNRTGYFICRYMIENLKIPPEDALSYFEQARGHAIDMAKYLKDLKNLCHGGSVP
uniref:Tyrosine specific protein phosphatases domain-containing protein n=1 Tax=Graphocephala atropunctata TaxID=36148 RepID=A0A1B6M954_9HEMI